MLAVTAESQLNTGAYIGTLRDLTSICIKMPGRARSTSAALKLLKSFGPKVPVFSGSFAVIEHADGPHVTCTNLGPAIPTPTEFIDDTTDQIARGKSEISQGPSAGSSSGEDPDSSTMQDDEE